MDNLFTEYFPHETIRSQQEYILDTISNNMDKRYIILECPTGIGKSAIGITLSNYYKSSFILTLTKQLQDQYMTGYNNGDMVSIKGKANYPCTIYPTCNCENAICNYSKIIKKECVKEEKCKYYKLRAQAFKSKKVVTSYQYILRAFDCAGIWKPRELMVFDECHDLEGQIINWGKVSLSISQLTTDNFLDSGELNYCKELLKENKINEYIDYLYTTITDLRKSTIEKINKIYLDSDYKLDKLTSQDRDNLSSTYEKYKILDFYYRRLDVYKITIKKENKNNQPHDCYFVKHIKDKEEVLITPLRIGNLFNYYLNRNILKKALFMSSSILDEDEFIRQLRIKKEDCLIIKMDSYFDYKRAPIINCNIAKTDFSHLDENLPKLVESIDKIINIHNNEKGIIHTSNYKIAKYIYENSIYQNKLLMIDNDNSTNESLIQEHINKTNSILLSPSLTTGVDLYDDQSRFQIIVKLPWLSLKDELIKKKLETSKKFYTINMLRTFLQSCGRSIRNSKDWCVTYVLDSSLKYFINRYKKYFYKQFVNRFIWDKKEFNLEEYNKYINDHSN